MADRNLNLGCTYDYSVAFGFISDLAGLLNSRLLVCFSAPDPNTLAGSHN